jgi:hypothetical protein
MISTMAGVPRNGVRTIHANGTVPTGAFTKGNRSYWGESDTRPILNLDDEAVRPARKPYAEMPDARVKIISKIAVCPGCGIIPPTGRPCDQCWS